MSRCMRDRKVQTLSIRKGRSSCMAGAKRLNNSLTELGQRRKEVLRHKGLGGDIKAEDWQVEISRSQVGERDGEKILPIACMRRWGCWREGGRAGSGSGCGCGL